MVLLSVQRRRCVASLVPRVARSRTCPHEHRALAAPSASRGWSDRGGRAVPLSLAVTVRLSRQDTSGQGFFPRGHGNLCDRKFVGVFVSLMEATANDIQRFSFVIPPPPGTLIGGAAESRLTQLHEGTPGLAWWRDRAVRRKSTSGASATGPVGRRATSAPSHRAGDPPVRRARKRQENKPALFKPIARVVPGAVRECDQSGNSPFRCGMPSNKKSPKPRLRAKNEKTPLVL